MTASVATTAGVRELHARAMGTSLHVVVVGGSDDLEHIAIARVADLERRWSRFLPDSELSRLNAAAGAPTIVSPETFDAIAAAVHAWRATGGRFDPTVLTALRAAGYDRDIRSLAPDAPGTSPPPGPAPGCAGVELDPVVRAVRLAPGVELDLGGIGKGLAADLVVTELLQCGASGACVNLGGDLRVAGAPPTDDGWVLDVAYAPGVLIALADGAAATSSRLERRWRRGGHELHHLLDPRSGMPAHTGIAAVTVVAGRAADAEMLTKAAFLAGAGNAPELVTSAGATGLLLLDDGALVALPGVEGYLR